MFYLKSDFIKFLFYFINSYIYIFSAFFDVVSVCFSNYVFVLEYNFFQQCLSHLRIIPRKIKFNNIGSDFIFYFQTAAEIKYLLLWI